MLEGSPRPAAKKARRGRNEGGISQRADGLWCASLSLGQTADGHRQRLWFYAATKREVQQQLVQAKADHAQGKPIVDGRVRLDAFLDRWLAEVVRPRARPATYAGYEVLVRLRLKPGLGHLPLNKLGPQHIQSWLNQLSAEGTSLRQGDGAAPLAPRTIQYAFAVLRRALGRAYKWGLIAENPADKVDPPRVPELEEPEVWTPEQARAFLAATAMDRLSAYYSVALAVGLRRGEALACRWEDVDIEAGALKVTGSLQRVQGALARGETKTRRSRRPIDLPAVCVEALRVHRARQVAEQEQAGARWQEHGLVFTTKHGTPIEPRNVNRSLNAVMRRAGLGHIRVHDLRHIAASLLLALEVPVTEVQRILGHANLATTLRYLHMVPGAGKATAAKMDRALRATAPAEGVD